MTGHIPDTYIPHIIYHNINIHYCTNMMYLVKNVEVICIAMITFAGGYYLLGQMEEELYVTFYFPNNRKIDVLSNISLIHMLRFVGETKMEPFVIMN